MRGLHPDFLDDLIAGRLSELLGRVRLDRTLDLQIRDDYLNVYYRGGSLLRLSRQGASYRADFDTRYARGAELVLPPAAIVDADAIGGWIRAFPTLKERMDLYFGHHPKDEREIQQLVARDNNVGSVARATDYFICDIEYANPHGRFDLVAVHWPSTPSDRKQSSGRRLVLAELKQGDGAHAGKAGLHSHLRDVEGFLSDPARVAELKEEMLTVFNQKRALGLIDCGRDLEGFSDEKPLFLLLFANHDPEKSRLRGELQTLPEPRFCEVRAMVGSLMGYGMFDPGLRAAQELSAQPKMIP